AGEPRPDRALFPRPEGPIPGLRCKPPCRNTMVDRFPLDSPRLSGLPFAPTRTLITRCKPYRKGRHSVRGQERTMLHVVESGRVQTMRGLACLLLVAFHAIGSTGASGLHVADDSAYRLFTNLFVHVRMPVFTFLSGLVYAWRPLRAGDER